MIRILQVVGGLSPGGTESSVMNLYRHVNRDQIQFDFISHHPENNFYEKEIIGLGGRIYYVPAFTGYNYITYRNAWKKLLDTINDARIIHTHVWSTAAIFLRIAKEKGYFTIAHSHSVSSGSGIQSFGRSLFILPLRGLPDYYMSCSEEAGKWLFGERIKEKKNFMILPNAIDTEIFYYDPMIRAKVRNNYHADNQFVIGHVGSFNSNKNQSFIMNFFYRIHEKKPQTVLWLIGEGQDMPSLKEKARKLKIENSVIFWGIRQDIPKLLQAMDVFVFPSKHESFGNAATEAGACGVPTICSVNVPNVGLPDNMICKLPLDNMDMWVDTILNIINDPAEHKDLRYNIKNTEIDINITSRKLERLYLTIRNGK